MRQLDRQRSGWARWLGMAAGIAAAGALAAGCGDKADTDAASASGSASQGKEGTDLAIGKVGNTTDLIDISGLCGDKPVTVGLAWAFGANAWRKTTRAELENEAKKCPNIEKVLYADANLNAQKSISDINSMVAQGVDVLLVYPDFGKAVLPALRAASAKGVKVVPFATSSKALGGTPGKDYVDAVTENDPQAGRTWATWMAKELDGKGNVVFLGGTPGNPTSQDEFRGVKEVLAKHPDIKLLNPDGPIDTNWDVANTQKVMAGLLTKYPEIDGVISDYGGSATGAVRAFTAAGRPLVPLTTSDQNELGCLYKKLKSTNPDFEFSTVSARNWIIRPALRKGMAAYQGKANGEPSIVNLPIIEDSTNEAMPPKCNPALPGDAILSSQLSESQLATLLK